MADNINVELVDDIITFFKRLSANDELAKRDFDNSEVMSENYCNYIMGAAEKYGLYDYDEDMKDVNYTLTLEDNLSDFF